MARKVVTSVRIEDPLMEAVKGYGLALPYLVNCLLANFFYLSRQEQLEILSRNRYVMGNLPEHIRVDDVGEEARLTALEGLGPFTAQNLTEELRLRVGLSVLRMRGEGVAGDSPK